MIWKYFKTIEAAVFIGFLTIVTGISYAYLLFSQELLHHLPLGIGATLMSIAIVTPILAFRGTITASVSTPPAIVAVLLSVMATPIAIELKETGHVEQIVPTVFALIIITSLAIGFSFLSFGYFHLGRLIRFIPNPVIGGALAGVGWLITIRAIPIMTDIPLKWANIPLLFHYENLIHILPGMALAFLLLAVNYRIIHYRTFVIVMGLFLVLLLGLYWFAHIHLSESRYVGKIIPSKLWPAIGLRDLLLVNWYQVILHTGQIVLLIFTVVLGFLFMTGGLEVIFDKDIEINRELESVGIANIATGLMGGMAGHQAPVMVIMAKAFGLQGPFIAIVTSLMAVFLLFTDSSFLSYLPKGLMGGAILYFGLGLLIEWAYFSLWRFPRLDYILILLTLVAVVFYGFMEGMTIGIAVSALIFIIKHSQTDIIKYRLSGSQYQSQVSRSLAQQDILKSESDQIAIFLLQGFIFFGTAYGLIDEIKNSLKNERKMKWRFLILDFRLVNGIDSSAIWSFRKLLKITNKHNIVLLFTDLKPEIRRQFDFGGHFVENDASLKFFKSLDYGFEWCEDQLLKTIVYTEVEKAIPSSFESMKQYFESVSLPAAHTLFQQGQISEELYIIESGRVTVSIKLPNGVQHRLRSLGSGSLVGECGYCMKGPRMTTVVTDVPTTVYVIKKDKLQELMQEHPQMVLSFHEQVEQILAERVAKTEKIVEALIL